MTQLEIFKATVSHQHHSNFLFYASFTPALIEKIKEKYGLERDEEIRQFFGMYNPVAVQPLYTGNEQTPDFSRYFTDIEKPEGAFINSLGVLEIPAKFHHFTGYISPLRNAKSFKDIEEFPYPPSEGFEITGMKEMVEKAHKNGRVASTWVGHMYENAWQVRGYEEFLMDMIERPEWCEYILDRFMERNLNITKLAASAGVDVITTGDDVANQNALMFSLPMWRKFMRERWVKVYSVAKAIKPDIQIWYHSDGNINAIIPEMIEIGLTILNPLQPECMDIVKIKKDYGKYLVFDGTIGTQTTMPFGSPEEVKNVVRKRKKELGYDGALILSPTHVLEPEVPLENIEAFISTCKEQQEG
ncbi:MAG TPA: uroporphyrinogen decarboxylase family protein [bacterium]|nr:uroporphyrinogen decarboxylase family protein [bacterium]HPP29538.1 uroporphyrinogen decarboxylase family protein [bacterium]